MREKGNLNRYTKGIFDPYTKDLDPEHWIPEFPELMWSLGFEMDCYQSYKASFDVGEEDCRIPAKEREDVVLSNLAKCDVQIVGNYVFSRFRELTHWSDYGYEEEKAVYFFPRAFAILIGKIEEKISRESQ